MSIQSLGAGKARRDDSNAKVTTAVLRPGMAGVSVTIVNDLEFVWCERLLEPSSDHGNAVGSHRRTRSGCGQDLCACEQGAAVLEAARAMDV